MATLNRSGFPRVSDFIETMARLIANPDLFTDEPRFHSPH